MIHYVSLSHILICIYACVCVCMFRHLAFSSPLALSLQCDCFSYFWLDLYDSARQPCKSHGQLENESDDCVFNAFSEHLMGLVFVADACHTSSDCRAVRGMMQWQLPLVMKAGGLIAWQQWFWKGHVLSWPWCQLDLAALLFQKGWHLKGWMSPIVDALSCLQWAGRPTPDSLAQLCTASGLLCRAVMPRQVV